MCEQVLTRCKHLGFSIITIGGGDPMRYDFIDDLLIRARECFPFVHLDTNLLRMNAQRAEVVNANVNLIGIPVDGSTAALHNLVRNAPNHFETIEQNISFLDSSRLSIKINTVATTQNLADILSIGESIKIFHPTRWSVYEYWPLGIGLPNQSNFILSVDQYAALERDLSKRYWPFIVETNSVKSRDGTYLFVTQAGQLYILDSGGNNGYLTLGSIFDDDVVATAMSIPRKPLRTQAESRYS